MSERDKSNDVLFEEWDFVSWIERREGYEKLEALRPSDDPQCSTYRFIPASQLEAAEKRIAELEAIDTIGVLNKCANQAFAASVEAHRVYQEQLAIVEKERDELKAKLAEIETERDDLWSRLESP
jgi:chromosome segregation ATPase